ncbi:hypothetical protein BAE44_0001983 [Dichanthelium oligosanthes]|uniref:Disease resistance protein winged helix domain-containing protein n=1 Tax=Dichanthelium oligosanthes TaxID=888268 RepID=A0A1E5WIN8_9POAL|nr:hypothetical protein BAE44_0001983 [Dichanthelium oligosanthes]
MSRFGAVSLLSSINAGLENAAKKRGLYSVPEMERYTEHIDHRYRSANQILCIARGEDLVEDLLKKITKEFGITIDESNMEMRSLVEAIRNCLEEDYEMKRRRLIRNWITAGFIEKNVNKTLENMEEGYLNELVNRSGEACYKFHLLISYTPATKIWDAPQLNQVEIDEGALGIFVELEFSDCPELKHLPHGIKYLRTLAELYLEDTAEELIEKLRKERESDECNEELMKVGHVRKVVIRLSGKKLGKDLLTHAWNG